MKNLFILFFMAISGYCFSQSPCHNEVVLNSASFSPPPGGVSSNVCTLFPQIHFSFVIGRTNIPKKKMKFKLFHSSDDGISSNDVRFFSSNTNNVINVTTSSDGTRYITEFEVNIPNTPNPIVNYDVDLLYEVLGNGFPNLSGQLNYRLEVYIEQNGAFVICPDLEKTGNIFSDLVGITTFDIVPGIFAPNDHASDVFPFSNTLGTLAFPNDLKIVDDLIVDADLHLRSTANPNGRPQSENSNLYLGADRSIIVESGVTLTMWNYNVTSPACPGQGIGKGIYVEGGGTLDVSYCQFLNLQGAITLEEGATLILDNNYFENNQKGIWVIGDADIQQFSNNTFENCENGVFAVNADDLELVSAANEGSENYFVDCTNGMKFTNSSANIERNMFDNCSTGINVTASSANTNIRFNKIGFSHRGILGSGAEMQVSENGIGTSTKYGTGPIAIDVKWSKAEIYSNAIKADQRGIFINYALAAYDDQVRVFDNWISVDGSNAADEDGIYSFLTQDMEISNNRIQGSGQRTGLRLYSGHGCTVDYNTFEASDYENGISVSGGKENMILNNEFLNDPVNGILCYASTVNLFKDNDINYDNVGLMIGRLSDVQTIQCNNFLTPGISISIDSEVGEQKFHSNWFAEIGTKARFLTTTNNNFIYDKNKPRHRPAEASPYFIPQAVGGNDVAACDVNSGSGIPAFPPEVLCSMVSNLTADEYWQKLRQLLGRYFDTHGPNQLPDCIPECEMVEFVKDEYELRKAMKEQSEGAGSSATLANVQSVAAQQIVYYGEQDPNQGGPTQTDPCEGDEVFELYKETYKSLLKEANSESLTATDVQELQSTAALCVEEFGEVVVWARGILNTYPQHDYVEAPCESAPLERLQAAEESALFNIAIHPNPVDDYLNVLIESDLDAIKEVSLINANGQIVYRTAVSNSELRIKTANYPAGLYLLLVDGQDGQTKTKKVIVQH